MADSIAVNSKARSSKGCKSRIQRCLERSCGRMDASNTKGDGVRPKPPRFQTVELMTPTKPLLPRSHHVPVSPVPSFLPPQSHRP